jgi:MFS superfamily sulfate permease-like transporter
MTRVTLRAWIVVAALLAVVAVGVGSLLSWWDWKTLIGWRALVDYIDPEGATGRKDAVQVYAVIVAGMVAAITAAVGLANLRFTRKSLAQQRDLEADRAREQRDLEEHRAQGTALQAYYEQMGKLLTEHNLGTTERDDIRLLARANLDGAKGLGTDPQEQAGAIPGRIATST